MLHTRVQSLPVDTEFKNDLGVIHNNAEVLAILVNNILEFARPEAGKHSVVAMESIHLPHLMQQITQVHQLA